MSDHMTSTDWWGYRSDHTRLPDKEPTDDPVGEREGVEEQRRDEGADADLGEPDVPSPGAEEEPPAGPWDGGEVEEESPAAGEEPPPGPWDGTEVEDESSPGSWDGAEVDEEPPAAGEELSPDPEDGGEAEDAAEPRRSFAARLARRVRARRHRRRARGSSTSDEDVAETEQDAPAAEDASAETAEDVFQELPDEDLEEVRGEATGEAPEDIAEEAPQEPGESDEDHSQGAEAAAVASDDSSEGEDEPADEEVDEEADDDEEEEPPAGLMERGARRWGRRQSRQARKRRTKRRRRVAVVGLVVVGALAAVAAVATFVVRVTNEKGGEKPPDDVVAAEPPQSLLLVRRPEGPEPALDVTLFSAVSGGGPSSVIMIPIGTFMDVPGIGLERLGFALQYGGIDLVEATVENELGINIDHTATVTDAGLTHLFARMGGLQLNVPARVIETRPDGQRVVTVKAGEQHLDGARLAYYWVHQPDDRDELKRITRQERVLATLFAAAEADPAILDRLLEGGVAPLETSADAGWLRQMLGRLAASRGSNGLKLQLLPVEPFAGPDPTGLPAYRIQVEALEQMVNELLSGSIPPHGGPQAVRVQVLNGVGVPGIGQQVGTKLQGGGFRIELTENANHFDHQQTQIVIYAETPADQQAARRVQERLGVGRIVLSRQPVSAVDLTIVVGHDFLAETAATS